MEAGTAGPLVANGIDELPGLIVAKGHQRIAFAGIARRAGPFPELLGNGDCLQAGTARFASLQLVPFTGDKDERAFTAINLDVIETAPAFVAAAGQFAALEHT